MDLNQVKLSKDEWNSIEIPVSPEEKNILSFIKGSYENVKNKKNDTLSLMSFLKLDNHETKIHDYLYTKYFDSKVKMIEKKNNVKFNIKINSKMDLKTADKIRIEQNNIKNIESSDIIENVLLNHISKYKKYFGAMSLETKKYDKYKSIAMYHVYTLCVLLKYSIINTNVHIVSICQSIISDHNKVKETIKYIILNSKEYIENNKEILKYKDIELYEHQKKLFSLFNKKDKTPKLVLYTAPTGTGKTISPIALSNNYRIVFLCAARHVGLAIAKSSISLGKKVAFAFGCETVDDIRLHNFAAKEFITNTKTGGIFKIDNSDGSLVEIMITDIKSYVIAMHYMCAFNKSDDLILYWDEPTISLDYDSHPLHSIIHNNWTENRISNIVLSSATLPREHEIRNTIMNFEKKFKDGLVISIEGHDFKKSIPIVNKDGYVVLPHFMCETYDQVERMCLYLMDNLSLLRYLDFEQITCFIKYVLEKDYINISALPYRHFSEITDITMESVKKYYLQCLGNIKKGLWGAVFTEFRFNRKQMLVDNKTKPISKSFSTNSYENMSNQVEFTNSIGNPQSGEPITRTVSANPTSTLAKSNVVNITTNDAYTLTDGPTIYLADNVMKIAKFLLQQSEIPSVVMDEITKKLNYNNAVNDKIAKLENELEFEENKVMEKNVKDNDDGNNKKDGTNKKIKNCKKINRNIDDDSNSASEIKKISNEINKYRNSIKCITLNETFVPNKKEHLQKWKKDSVDSNSFTSNISENIVQKIMEINGISDIWKILLMMGIGVFTNDIQNKTYLQIMKNLADEQKLYLIIASSDYIYGTNYQFCHAYISKDLKLTQEKIIQSLGRIGRGNIQQNYTVRFRKDEDIDLLFKECDIRTESENMNLLFGC